MYCVLYNPLSGNGQGYNRVLTLKEILKDQTLEFKDIREVQDYRSFMASITGNDALVIAGGDGTLNKFVNFTDGMTYPANLFYYACGSGNDFRHDVEQDPNKLIPLTEYIRDLPVVTVKGKSYRFINGIGYGIDGYRCEVGDEIAKNTDKPINYTSIAIKGLLFHYKTTHATVTVDGVTREFDKVWLAPTMNGRFYGGGMMVAPDQNRLNSQKNLSTVVLSGSGKLKTLMVFPSIFKGEHIRHEEMFTVLTGHEITVKFDRPTALQIDGETVLGVTEYTVKAQIPANAANSEKMTAGV